MIVGHETVNIISIYAPQVRAETDLKKLFWKDLEGLIQSIPQSEKSLLEETLMVMSGGREVIM